MMNGSKVANDVFDRAVVLFGVLTAGPDTEFGVEELRVGLGILDTEDYTRTRDLVGKMMTAGAQVQWHWYPDGRMVLRGMHDPSESRTAVLRN